MSASGHIAFPPPSLRGSFSVYALSSVADDVWAAGRAAGPERIVRSSRGEPWQLVPDSDGSGSAQLYGVHATASDDVWAVGYEHVGSSNADRTHIAHRDASGWQRVASPNVAHNSNRLVAVDAWGPDDACAVGASTAYPPSSTPLGLPPVAAWDTLVLRWDGAHWAAAANPGRGLLADACAIDAETYWAVGTAAPARPARGGALVPLVALYADGSWHQAEPPGEGTLFGVAATGPDDVWAVGQDQDPARLGGPLILHYDGHEWAAIDAPAATGQAWLNDVVCAARDDVWAVGAHQPTGGGIGPLILHFDGSSWARVEPPPTAGASVLLAVTARAGQGAWAGGFASPTLDDNGYALSPATSAGGGR